MDDYNTFGLGNQQTAKFYGIDRPSIDYSSSTVNYLNNIIYQVPSKNTSILRPFPQWSRETIPVTASLPWDLNCVCNFLAHSLINKNRSPPSILKWFPDGRRLLSGTTVGELAIWNGTHFGFEDIKRLPLGGGAISSLEWSPREDRLFVGDALGQVIVLSLALNPLENEVYEGLSNAVKNLSLSPFGDKLSACAESCYPIIWDVETRDIERYLSADYIDSRSIITLKWHPNKALIATGCSTNWLHFWDPRTAKVVANLQPHKRGIISLKWTKSGNYLLTGSKDTTLKLWDIRYLKCLNTYRLMDIQYQQNNIQLPLKQTNEPTCISWNPIQEHVFAIGDSFGCISYWSILHSNKPIFSIARAHGSSHKSTDRESTILTIDWHPLGHMLVTSGMDRQIKFWSRGPPGCVMGNMIDASALSNSSKMFQFPMNKYINVDKSDFNDTSPPHYSTLHEESESVLKKQKI